MLLLPSSLTFSFRVVKLQNVIGFCCDFLFSWLDESNILEVLRLADLYGLQQLKGQIHVYLLRNIKALSRTEAYRRLPQEAVFRALSSDELAVHTEDEVYEAALRYHCSPEELEDEEVYAKVTAQVGATPAAKAAANVYRPRSTTSPSRFSPTSCFVPPVRRTIPRWRTPCVSAS